MTFIIILFSLQFSCLSHDTLVYIAHTDCKLFIYRLYSTAVAGVGAIILAATQPLDGCCMSAGGLSVHPYVSPNTQLWLVFAASGGECVDDAFSSHSKQPGTTHERTSTLPTADMTQTTAKRYYVPVSL